MNDKGASPKITPGQDVTHYLPDVYRHPQHLKRPHRPSTSGTSRFTPILYLATGCQIITTLASGCSFSEEYRCLIILPHYISSAVVIYSSSTLNLYSPLPLLQTFYSTPTLLNFKQFQD